MNWSISSLVVGIAVIGLSCMQCLVRANEVEASGGRITFTGAIVEPTCSASVASIDTAASISTSGNATPQRFACGIAHGTADSNKFYSMTVVDLDATAVNHDPVLDYFVGYVKAAGDNMASAKLVTQTFE